MLRMEASTITPPPPGRQPVLSHLTELCLGLIDSPNPVASMQAGLVDGLKTLHLDLSWMDELLWAPILGHVPNLVSLSVISEATSSTP